MAGQHEEQSRGVVTNIHVAPAAGSPMHPVDEVLAVEGKGLAGDRYFAGAGTYSSTKPTGRHVTLVETEVLDSLRRDYDIDLPPAKTRRNIATRGVSLNDLVGREFTIGAVRLRGVDLCEPCAHIAEVAGGKNVLRGMVHRGGLRADIVSGGTIHIGDTVEAVD